MAGLDDISKSVQLQQSIQNSLGISSQLSVMFNDQESIAKKLADLSRAPELAKNMQRHFRMFDNSTISAIEVMTKVLDLQSKFTIPQTTLDAIASINLQHEQLFGGIRGITEALKVQSSALSQINNLNFALTGISGQISAIAAQQRNRNIIDEFEEVTEQAIELAENLTDEITEEQQRQFQILLSSILAFFNKHKTLGKDSFRVINIFLIIAGIHQYYDFLKEKPEFATKAEINQINFKQDSISYYIQILSEQLMQTKVFKNTNRMCEVKLKPKSKALTVSKLPQDFELVVLQVHHKWVLISYFDPKDNLPDSGWIMKKYLGKCQNTKSHTNSSPPPPN
jgi:hypothetical protein